MGENPALVHGNLSINFGGNFTADQVVITRLSHRRGQEVDDSVVGHGDHALAVDLDDAVADADTTPLGDAAAEQTADLKVKVEKKWRSLSSLHCLCVFPFH